MPTIIVGDVEVPDVVGDDLATAISELDAVFLAYTTQSQSSAEPAGTVIAQDPAAETEVDPNDPETVVTLTVSSGPAPEPEPEPEGVVGFIQPIEYVGFIQ